MTSEISGATTSESCGGKDVKFHEFNMCVLGISGVGKTSLLRRLTSGTPFSRKSTCKPSLEDVATKYSVEGVTSAGPLLFNFLDWGWEQKRKEESINQQLMRGSDGALFVYDCTEKRSKNDFSEHNDWYQRACGFDKPWLIISNKNDQKKKSVQDEEGKALAKAGPHRDYIAISLVDDSGLDEMMLMLSKIMMKDLNLSICSPFKQASAETLAWSEERIAMKVANIGLGHLSIKNKKVLLVALNTSVIAKFSEVCSTSEYELETVGSIDLCEEELKTQGSSIYAVVLPPAASTTQQNTLKLLAETYNVKYTIAAPRSIVESLNSI